MPMATREPATARSALDTARETGVQATPPGSPRVAIAQGSVPRSAPSIMEPS
jgi:hypothetical protein